MAVTNPGGSWTYEDLLSLPDDGRRYEIIEGVPYEMPSPTATRAVVISNIMLLLGPVIEALGGWLLTAPLDVFIPGANPVQPDIVLLLPESNARLSARGVEGIPSLVIEVVSPTNRGHDLVTKRTLYSSAGVREYWLVDPASRTVDVLTLQCELYRLSQTATGSEAVLSPLLSGVSLPLPQVFSRIDEIHG